MASVGAESDVYSIYGLLVEVAGAGGKLAAVPGQGHPEAQLDFGGFPDDLVTGAKEQVYGPVIDDGRETPSLQIFRLKERPSYYFRFAERIEFLVESDGTNIRGRWPRTYSLPYVAPIILGPLFGYLLRARGVTTLHASVVEIGGRAVIITGDSGAGKSTTAAAFAELGFGVLSDDLAPLRCGDGRLTVAPGYPRICLWPESVRMLFGSADAKPLLTEGWEKRFIDLTEPKYTFCRRELPLGAVYHLGQRTETGTPASIAGLEAQPALAALIRNTYGVRFGGQEQAVGDLRMFGRLVSGVPVRKVTPSADPALLYRMCETIAGDASLVFN